MIYDGKPMPKIIDFGVAKALHQQLPGPDAVATAVELTARTVAGAVGRWTPAGVEVVASGGGCHHPGLMAALERHLAAQGGHALRIQAGLQ